MEYIPPQKSLTLLTTDTFSYQMYWNDMSWGVADLSPSRR